MIYIEKNTTNDVVLELSVLDPTLQYYVFGILWETGNSPYVRYLISPNLSTTKDRYDLFQITESDLGLDTNLVFNSPIFLNPGQYDYLVWGSAIPITSQNLQNVVSGYGISSGRMVVNGESATVPEVYLSTFPNPLPTPNVYQ